MERRAAAAAVGLLLVLLRAPSLIEPPQFSDEGTYADIGFALNHGSILYRSVWDNKPPGIYWLAAVVNLVHTSVIAYHVVAAAVVVVTGVGVYVVARRLQLGVGAWAATFAFATLASLPSLGGDVLNAEAVGAAGVTWAVILVIKGAGSRFRLRHALAGALVAGALLCKATFLADAVMIVTLPVLLRCASGAPLRPAFTRVAGVVAGSALVTAAALAGLAYGGSLAGLGDVLFRQDVTYLQQVGASAGGSGASLPATGVLTALTASRLAILLAVGGAATLALARRRSRAGAVLISWLTWDLVAATLSARGLTHYVQQAEPALCLAMAMLVQRFVRGGNARAALAVLVTTIAAWLACVATVLAPVAEVATVTPLPLTADARDLLSPHPTTHYLFRGWERLLRVIPRSTYEAGFGLDTARVLQAIRFIGGHTVVSDRIFVWGRMPWAYALSGRLPSGEYVTLDAAYRVDPGAQARLLAQLNASPPTVLVAIDALPAPLQTALARLGYTNRPGSIAGTEYWLAPWAR
jgi:hypothetical protein